MRILRFFPILLLMFFVSPAFAQDLLTYGEPVTAEITVDQRRFRYSFEGTADEMIYVAAFVPNPNMDITVSVFGPNGTQLGSATDNAIGTVLGPFTLTSSGRYTVEMFQPDYNIVEVGSVELTVDQTEVTAIKPDGSYSGELIKAGAVAFFSYTGPANELFGYSITGQNIGFYMVAPNGETFVQGFSTEDLYEPLHILPESGGYTAVLQTANAAGTSYTLSLNPINIVELAPDESVSSRIEMGSTQIFRFTSGVDELWRVDVNAPEAQYSARLDVRSVDDPMTNITSDSGSGTDGAPRIDPFVSPNAGDYYILLSAGVDFDYTITLQPSSAARLEMGAAQQASVSPETGTLTYIYFGIADEKVRITLDAPGGQPGMIVYSPQDELVSFFARSAGKTMFEVTLPETGLYRFTLRSAGYDGATLDFNLLLERVQ